MWGQARPAFRGEGRASLVHIAYNRNILRAASTDFHGQDEVRILAQDGDGSRKYGCVVHHTLMVQMLSDHVLWYKMVHAYTCAKVHLPLMV